MPKKRMILWHYCPKKYISGPDTNPQGGGSINFIFGQKEKKEDWQDEEDENSKNDEDQYMKDASIEYWMGHTNFNITEEIANFIHKMDGVEGLKLLSRYCLVISPGMLFNFSDIRKEIEAKFCDKIEQKEMAQLLTEKYKNWIIYVDGKGDMEYVGTNNDEDAQFERDKKYFELGQQKNGGQIIIGD